MRLPFYAGQVLHGALVGFYRDRLDAVAVQLERGVSAGQERPQDPHVILRPHLVKERREGDLDLPANVLSVLPGFAELSRLGAFPEVELRDLSVPTSVRHFLAH